MKQISPFIIMILLIICGCTNSAIDTKKPVLESDQVSRDSVTAIEESVTAVTITYNRSSIAVNDVPVVMATPLSDGTRIGDSSALGNAIDSICNTLATTVSKTATVMIDENSDYVQGVNILWAINNHLDSIYFSYDTYKVPITLPKPVDSSGFSAGGHSAKSVGDEIEKPKMFLTSIITDSVVVFMTKIGMLPSLHYIEKDGVLLFSDSMNSAPLLVWKRKESGEIVIGDYMPLSDALELNKSYVHFTQAEDGSFSKRDIVIQNMNEYEKQSVAITTCFSYLYNEIKTKNSEAADVDEILIAVQPNVSFAKIMPFVDAVQKCGTKSISFGKLRL